jgi:hypothetical protein
MAEFSSHVVQFYLFCCTCVRVLARASARGTAVALCLKCAGVTAPWRICCCCLLQAPQLLRELLEREVGEHISHLEKRRKELVRHMPLQIATKSYVLVSFCKGAWHDSIRQCHEVA